MYIKRWFHPWQRKHEDRRLACSWLRDHICLAPPRGGGRNELRKPTQDCKKGKALKCVNLCSTAFLPTYPSITKKCSRYLFLKSFLPIKIPGAWIFPSFRCYLLSLILLLPWSIIIGQFLLLPQRFVPCLKVGEVTRKRSFSTLPQKNEGVGKRNVKPILTQRLKWVFNKNYPTYRIV